MRGAERSRNANTSDRPIQPKLMRLKCDAGEDLREIHGQKDVDWTFPMDERLGKDNNQMMLLVCKTSEERHRNNNNTRAVLKKKN